MGGSAQIELGTKAETLDRLQGKLRCSSIMPLLMFTVEQWSSSADDILKRVAEEFGERTVIVRSSTRSEDLETASNAGAYLSVADVSCRDSQKLRSAICSVIDSYSGDDPLDQVLVQEQVTDIAICGVLFTRDLNSLAPYYVVNYDDTTSSHDSVTSGTGAALKTYLRFRGSSYAPLNPCLHPLFEAVEELEEVFASETLDIEFAIDSRDHVYVLQVRPIVVTDDSSISSVEQVSAYLAKIESKAQSLNVPHPGLFGRRGMYSVMTDWNPAEMIGTRPRMLPLSLYKELITDSTWAYQRDNYGYKNLRSYPLLVSFLGFPYIDVRVSFNSFVPKALDEHLSHKLVDYYMNRLSEQPTDHDKVEFNIIHSCYCLDTPERLSELLQFGFTELELDRIKFTLLDLTNHAINPSTGLYKRDLEKIKKLPDRFDLIVQSEISITDKIYWLIHDCARYGTLPFAGLARAGFIAVQFLHSFVSTKLITEGEMQSYMNSLVTVASELASDSHALLAGRLSREVFLQRYGHLRPGTYDILSLRYDEAFEHYFRKETTPAPCAHDPSFSFSDEQKSAISRMLTQNGVQVSAEELLLFIKEAIEGREYGKFVFTRSVSQVLVLLEELGIECGISREDMSFVDIRTVLGLYSSLEHEDPREILQRDIEKNKRSYHLGGQIRLPQVIRSEQDIYDFFVNEVEPNFITNSRVTQIVVVEEDLLDIDLSDKIVFIRSADPGYDWIFSRNVAGLVTMYGGANSHMAIRCAELSIPAVIGCGEVNFELWSASRVLEIDCATKQVRPVG